MTGGARQSTRKSLSSVSIPESDSSDGIDDRDRDCMEIMEEWSPSSGGGSPSRRKTDFGALSASRGGAGDAGAQSTAGSAKYRKLPKIPLSARDPGNEDGQKTQVPPTASTGSASASSTGPSPKVARQATNASLDTGSASASSTGPSPKVARQATNASLELPSDASGGCTMRVAGPHNSASAIQARLKSITRAKTDLFRGGSDKKDDSDIGERKTLGNLSSETSKAPKASSRHTYNHSSTHDDTDDMLAGGDMDLLEGEVLQSPSRASAAIRRRSSEPLPSAQASELPGKAASLSLGHASSPQSSQSHHAPSPLKAKAAAVKSHIVLSR
jgi:hypothetical protein